MAWTCFRPDGVSLASRQPGVSQEGPENASFIWPRRRPRLPGGGEAGSSRQRFQTRVASLRNFRGRLKEAIKAAEPPTASVLTRRSEASWLSVNDERIKYSVEPLCPLHAPGTHTRQRQSPSSGLYLRGTAPVSFKAALWSERVRVGQREDGETV